MIGISSAYGGVLSALEIIYTLSPLPAKRIEGLATSTSALTELMVGQKYREREEVYAVYERKKVTITIEERDITL
jgi:hypothetical protein